MVATDGVLLDHDNGVLAASLRSPQVEFGDGMPAIGSTDTASSAVIAGGRAATVDGMFAVITAIAAPSPCVRNGASAMAVQDAIPRPARTSPAATKPTVRDAMTHPVHRSIRFRSSHGV